MAAFWSRKVLLYHIFHFSYPLTFILTTIYGIGDLTPGIRNIKGTKVMFWYKWLEQSSPVPGKGVGTGKKIQTNKLGLSCAKLSSS